MASDKSGNAMDRYPDRLQRLLQVLRGRPAIAASIAVLVAAALLKPLLDAAARDYLPPFITFYPAVVLIRLLGGTRAGLASLGGALVIGCYFWIPPYISFKFDGLGSLYSVICFAVFGGMISVTLGLMRE